LETQPRKFRWSLIAHHGSGTTGVAPLGPRRGRRSREKLSTARLPRACVPNHEIVRRDLARCQQVSADPGHGGRSGYLGMDGDTVWSPAPIIDLCDFQLGTAFDASWGSP
jgi:hypothetical protein